MADIIVGIRIDQLPGPRIRMYGGKTKILYMIGAALFIQQYVPIRPADGAIIKIMDHTAAIALAQFPVMNAVHIERAVAAFRKQQVLIREGLMHPLYILKHL